MGGLHMSEVMQAYNTGVLSPEVHGRLVANLDCFARRANIMEQMVLHKMSEFSCTAIEIDYVKKIRRQPAMGNYGLIYTGKETKPVLTRMMAVAGACLRNFVEAKVVTLQELLSDMKEGSPPEATVLLVPNFFVAKSEGGKIADWHIAELLGLLYARMAAGKQTFLYVSDFQALQKTYGDPIAEHLKNHFKSVAA
jgi:hypothetical protein